MCFLKFLVGRFTVKPDELVQLKQFKQFKHKKKYLICFQVTQ